VEQRHIDKALQRDSSHCAVAEAIKEAIPDATFVSVDLQTIRFSRRGLRYVFLTPHLARDCIVNFDQGLRDLLKPFELKLRPAIIARSGKKKTHTPTNEELRGTGLTVNKTQLHLSDAGRESAQRELSASQRFNADGSRNISPDRVDGLYVPPPPKSPRVSRALISGL
jgi:hypothetical protein